MMDNALSTAGSIASPIGKFAPNAGREGWSVTRWVEQAVAAQDAGEPHGWLWITAPERQRAAMLPILSSISALAISNVLGSPEREARRIYLIADEIGSLPAIAEFEGALTRGRKYGLRVIGAVQSIEQLRDPKRYGRAGAASLLSCFSTKFLFRAADPESSAWCSKLVGQRHVTRMLENSSRGESSQRSQQGGGSSSSSTSSKNEHHSIEAAILDSEFTSLADLRCYLMLPGHAGAFGPVAVDYVPLRGEQPFFVPRPPPSAGTTPPVPVQPTPPSGAADGGEAPGADDLLSALDSLGGDAETETEPQ